MPISGMIPNVLKCNPAMQACTFTPTQVFQTLNYVAGGKYCKPGSIWLALIRNQRKIGRCYPSKDLLDE
jgi:hypothetical protein